MRSFLKPVSCILLLAFLLAASADRSASPRKKSQKTSSSSSSSSNLVEISCAQARYPSLCLRTLSAYASTAKTPSTLAQAAVSVALRRSRDAADFLSGSVNARSGGGKRERGALKDCVEQIGDSVEELSQSLGELKRLRPGTFRARLLTR
ncbi:hypothetical protein H6P81_015003 [Aristolochia fimbriata]|uniref:Pectinesterase inhibitor domain-containing protein n=1 Tax=Aristolochia fimbriata TaxID=158543 RepID=A0AAV7E492_ARIFI|nr:hypothetical protein H6P81_015003 [Aristolochia fimbriata]